jgi:hypothetical protein
MLASTGGEIAAASLCDFSPFPREPNPLQYLEGLTATYMWVRSHMSVRVVPLQYCRGDSSLPEGPLWPLCVPSVAVWSSEVSGVAVSTGRGGTRGSCWALRLHVGISFRAANMVHTLHHVRSRPKGRGEDVAADCSAHLTSLI